MTGAALEALAVMRDYGNARAFFATVAHAVTRLDAVTCELDALAEGMPHSGSGHAPGSGIGKPTEARALWLLCDAPAMAQRLQDERERLRYVIGCGLVLCRYAADGIGATYGDVLERHYIDCEPWASVAEDVGYSVGHAKRLGGVALDWLDWKSEGR